MEYLIFNVYQIAVRWTIMKCFREWFVLQI
nr:MAG TPA: Protein of unknown function (DUF3289) [Caudoviricetes sp.]